MATDNTTTTTATPAVMSDTIHEQLRELSQKTHNAVELCTSSRIAPSDARCYIERISTEIAAQLDGAGTSDTTKLEKEAGFYQLIFICDSCGDSPNVCITLYLSVKVLDKEHKFDVTLKLLDGADCIACTTIKYHTALAAWKGALDQFNKSEVMTDEERAACDARALEKEPSMKKPATFARWAPKMWRELHQERRPLDPQDVVARVEHYGQTTTSASVVPGSSRAAVPRSTRNFVPPQLDNGGPVLKYDIAIPDNFGVAQVVEAALLFGGTPQQKWQLTFHFLMSMDARGVTSPENKWLQRACSREIFCPDVDDDEAQAVFSSFNPLIWEPICTCYRVNTDGVSVDIDAFTKIIEIRANHFRVVESAKSKVAIKHWLAEESEIADAAHDGAARTLNSFPSVGTPASAPSATLRNPTQEIEATTSAADGVEDAKKDLNHSGLTAAANGMTSKGATGVQGEERKVLSREESRIAVDKGFQVSKARGEELPVGEEMTERPAKELSSIEVCEEPSDGEKSGLDMARATKNSRKRKTADQGEEEKDHESKKQREK